MGADSPAISVSPPARAAAVGPIPTAPFSATAGAATTAKPAMELGTSVARRLCPTAASCRSTHLRTAATGRRPCASWIQAAFLDALAGAPAGFVPAAVPLDTQARRRAVSRTTKHANSRTSAAAGPVACRVTADSSAPFLRAGGLGLPAMRVPANAATGLNACGPAAGSLGSATLVRFHPQPTMRVYRTAAEHALPTATAATPG